MTNPYFPEFRARAIERRTPRGKVYCAAVLDAFSRRIVGWFIDLCPHTDLVMNPPDMAIRHRRPKPGRIVHAHHGVQVM